MERLLNQPMKKNEIGFLKINFVGGLKSTTFYEIFLRVSTAFFCGFFSLETAYKAQCKSFPQCTSRIWDPIGHTIN